MNETELYRYARFVEMVGELADALVGKGSASADLKLGQMVAYGLDWIDYRDDLRADLARGTIAAQRRRWTDEKI